MTATTAADPGQVVALARTCAAESSRIWSLRATWWLVAATSLAVLGVATLFGYDVSDDLDRPDFTAWVAGQFAGMFGLFGIAATALVLAASDYGTGGIVPTLQWTPSRTRLLLARVGVVAGTCTLVGLVLVTGAAVVVWRFAPQVGLPVGEGLGSLAGTAFVYGCSSLLAAGLGLLLRNTGGGLVAVLALVLVLPLLCAIIGTTWSVDVAELLPGSGALHLLLEDGPGGPLETMTTHSARVVLGCWAAAAVLAGGWRLLRTDADR
jgi:hypothetical protein